MRFSRASEADWARDIVRLAGRLGLLAHFQPDSRRAAGTAGFPDIVIAGPRGVLFAELKMPDGETSAAQDWWGWMIGEAAGSSPYGSRHAAVRWVLWTVPDDAGSGRIEADLRRLAADA